MVVEVERLTKKYDDNIILENINFKIDEGEKVVIFGKSGSGKTTFLNLISTIDTEYDGTLCLFGNNIRKLRKLELSKIRRDKLGFIFQDYGLLENLNCKDNILLPIKSAGMEIKQDEYYFKLISVLNLENLLDKYPMELSGGEKQRVSIARAMAKKPKLVIADEITSALDPYTSMELMNYLLNVATELRVTLIMVTHDLNMVEFYDTYYFIKEKRLLKLSDKNDIRKMFFEENW